MIIQAAKSKSFADQARLQEIQRAERDAQKIQAANITALQAIGTRKRKLNSDATNYGVKILRISPIPKKSILGFPLGKKKFY